MSTFAAARTAPASTPRPDPAIDRLLRNTVLAGLMLVLAVPMARADTAWLGWLPLWLVGMPAVAWWALHHFRLPHWPARASRAMARRRRAPQARRRARGARPALRQVA